MLFTNDFSTVFRNIYRQLPPPLRRSFWFTAAISTLVAIMELALALAVSLLGVTLTTPEAILDLKPVRMFLEFCPPAAPFLQNQRTLLSGLLLCIVLALLLKMGASLYMYWKQGQFAQKIATHIEHTIFKGYLYGAYLWHVSQETALLQAHLGWNGHVASICLQALLAITYLSVTLLLLASVLAASPLIGLFVLTVCALCGIGIYRWTRHRMVRLNIKNADALVRFNRVTLSSLQGIREILIYRQQQDFLKQNDAVMHEFCQLRPRMEMLPPLPPMVLEVVGMAMLLVTVLYMNARGASLAYLTGTLTLMAAVAWRLLPTINRFMGCLLNAQAAMPYVHKVLGRMNEVRHTAGPASINAEPCPLEREIRIRDLSFRYPGCPPDKPDALHHISLTIRKGQKVGFVGTSGAGKSTLVGLLTGLMMPSGGEICVDDREMTPGRRAGWMLGIGYVPQSPFLLNASIAQNVAFSQWGKPVDQERVRACCRMAAMDFLKDLPDGVDTVVGERGIRLSGGQVQRISIARALYNNPHTLILDEATSALDGAAEMEIMQTVQRLDKAITVIIIAHRLSTVEACDEIFWLRDGGIAMHGPAAKVLDAYRRFLAADAPSGESHAPSHPAGKEQA